MCNDYIIIVMVHFLLLAQCNLELAAKREHQPKNHLIQTSLWPSLWETVLIDNLCARGYPTVDCTIITKQIKLCENFSECRSSFFDFPQCWNVIWKCKQLKWTPFPP